MKYLTFVDNINTFNLKNHQVLKLKFIQGGVLQNPPGSDRVNKAKGTLVHKQR